MRKPDFCIIENKAVDQLRSNCAADQRLSFRYMDRTIPQSTTLIRKFTPLAIFYDCTVWFVSDLVGNPEYRFSHDEAHLHTL